MRVAQVLTTHGLLMPDYSLMCTAGYRINLDRSGFVEQTVCELKGGRWTFSTEELDSALDRLVLIGLMTILTESDVKTERERRCKSSLPELDDGIYYQPGHVDFTERGYLLYREIIREIYGEDFLEQGDAGFNLDSADKHFDCYAVNASNCQRLMENVESGGDSSTGAELTTFVGSEGPTAIGQWRPNRFFLHRSGYHGVLRFKCAPES